MEAQVSPAEVPSLGELRERHLELLREWSNHPDESNLPADQADELRVAAQALGAWLDDFEDRDRAQSIIDYWTATLTSVCHRNLPELVKLDAFDPELAAAAVERGEAVIAPHHGTALERDIEAVLLCLVRPGARNRIVCRSPVERADLPTGDARPEAAGKVEGLIDQLVDARIIRRVPGDDRDHDRFEFMHGSVARAWPRLNGLIEERRSSNDIRDKLRATAQLWSGNNRDSGYLLSGPSLDEAGRYLGEDKLLDDFIRESRLAVDRRRRQDLYRWLIVLVVVLLLLAGAWYFSRQLGLSSNDWDRITTTETPNAAQQLSAPVPVAAGAPLPTLAPDSPGLGGALWIGTDSQTHLYDPATGEPVATRDVRQGSTYRLRVDTLLHADVPDATHYRVGDRIGLASAGALVVANGTRQAFSRPSGTHYWLRVRLIPRVSINYAAGGGVDPREVARRLLGSGVEVAAITSARIDVNHLTYYHEQEDDLADEVAGRLISILQNPDGTGLSLQCRFEDQFSRPAANLEIGLNLANVRFVPPGTQSSGKADLCDPDAVFE